MSTIKNRDPNVEIDRDPTMDGADRATTQCGTSGDALMQQQHEQHRWKAAFFKWLSEQSHRHDRVGALAREVAAPRHWVSRLISGGPSRAEIAHATATAMSEYDRQFARREPTTPQPTTMAE